MTARGGEIRQMQLAKPAATQQSAAPPPSSVRSEPLSTKFAFVYDNPRFSDAVLVLQTRKCTPAPIPRRIVSTAAHLWLTVTAHAASAAWLLMGGWLLPGGHQLAAAGSWLNAQASELLTQLLPLQEAADTAARTIHVSSAILAAASPVFKALLEQAGTASSAQLPSFLAHGARKAPHHGDRSVVALPVQPDQVASTEAVVKHAFTGELPMLSSSSEVLRMLLAAERLQAADCAELCMQQLEGPGAMDWDATLLLLHWQHTQHAHRQQLAAAGDGTGAATQAARPTSGARGAPTTPTAASHELLAPEPLPSESPLLAPLLARAQDQVLQQFGDLEVVWASAAQREQLLALPYDAVRAVLGHPQLRVASENTVLLAAAAWLARNGEVDGEEAGAVAAAVAWDRHRQQQRQQEQAGGEGRLLHARDDARSAASDGAKQGPLAAATPHTSPAQRPRPSKQPPPSPAGSDVRNTPDSKLESLNDWALMNQQEREQQQQQQQAAQEGAASDEEGSAFQDVCEEGLPPSLAQQHEIVATNSHATSRHPQPGQQRQGRHGRQQHGECDAGSVGALGRVEDLAMNAVRVPLLSYTYLLHVLPRLPPFQQHQQLVSSLQREALSYQAATAPRQAHMAAGAASSTTIAPNTTSAAATNAAAAPAATAAMRYSRRPASDRSILDFCYSFAPEQLSGSALPLLPRYHQIMSFGRGKQGGVNKRGSGAVSARAPMSQQQPCLVSDDYSFGGFTWSLVVTRDGFVGITWKMGPGVPGQELRLESRGAEVGVVFAISALSPNQQQQAKAAEAPGGQRAGGGKGMEVAGVHTRAYSSVQFVPANCAWGFTRFWGSAGVERFTDEQGMVTLRCVVSYVD